MTPSSFIGTHPQPPFNRIWRNSGLTGSESRSLHKWLLSFSCSAFARANFPPPPWKKLSVPVLTISNQACVSSCQYRSLLARRRLEEVPFSISLSPSSPSFGRSFKSPQGNTSNPKNKKRFLWVGFPPLLPSKIVCRMPIAHFIGFPPPKKSTPKMPLGSTLWDLFFPDRPKPSFVALLAPATGRFFLRLPPPCPPLGARSSPPKFSYPSSSCTCYLPIRPRAPSSDGTYSFSGCRELALFPAWITCCELLTCTFLVSMRRWLPPPPLFTLRCPSLCYFAQHWWCFSPILFFVSSPPVRRRQ